MTDHAPSPPCDTCGHFDQDERGIFCRRFDIDLSPDSLDGSYCPAFMALAQPLTADEIEDALDDHGKATCRVVWMPDGFHCTRAPGHDGDHLAGTWTLGEIVKRWPRTNAAQPDASPLDGRTPTPARGLGKSEASSSVAADERAETPRAAIDGCDLCGVKGWPDYQRLRGGSWVCSECLARAPASPDPGAVTAEDAARLSRASTGDRR